MPHLNMTPVNECPLCHKTAVGRAILISGKAGFSGAAGLSVECDRCGKFSISDDGMEEFKRLGSPGAMSGIAREWTELSRPLEITNDNLRSLINLAPQTLKEKKQRFLQALVRKFPQYNTHCFIDPKNDYPLAYASSENEFGLILAMPS